MAGPMFEEVFEEPEPDEVEVNPRPTYRTTPLYSSTAPDGSDWHDYFIRRGFGKAKVEEDPDEDEEESDAAFEVIEKGIADGTRLTLSATQKRILKIAEEMGMQVGVNASVVHYFDKIQKNDGKKAMAGDVVKPAHDVTNIFMGGWYPDSLLRFDAAWRGSPQKFSAQIQDPVGRWVQDEEITWRETRWMISGVKAFEAWLKEWATTLEKAKK